MKYIKNFNVSFFFLGIAFGAIICGLLDNNFPLKREHVDSTNDDRIENLEKRYLQDSIHIEMIEYNYDVLRKENQIFSSMLSEIENEPGGHEALKKLWDENN